MPGPLEGIKVAEMGLWVAGPSAAAILCDWGAQVVKIEPPTGDPFRGLFASVMGVAAPMNPPFELDNRGKRSIALDLEKDEARAIALQVIGEADVFVTNMRPHVLEQFGLDYDTLHERFPRLGVNPPRHIYQYQDQDKSKGNGFIGACRPSIKLRYNVPQQFPQDDQYG